MLQKEEGAEEKSDSVGCGVKENVQRTWKRYSDAVPGPTIITQTTFSDVWVRELKYTCEGNHTNLLKLELAHIIIFINLWIDIK